MSIVQTIASAPSSASITEQPSDELFEERLRQTIVRIISGERRTGLVVGLRLTTTGQCPADRVPAVICAIRELVWNAVEHGFYQRSCGQLSVAVHSATGKTLIEVEDDGWGTDAEAADRNGLKTLRALGAFSLVNRRQNSRTTGAVARLLISE